MTIFPVISELYPKLLKKDGEVGIEIEMEGENITFPIGKYWSKHTDGSLRGESVEYVLTKPVQREEVQKALLYLTTLFRKYDSTLRPSDRCGVHIHLNVQAMTFQELFNFVLLYLVFENVLLHYCGDSREGNLFCLRASDATALIDALIEARKKSSFDSLASPNFRYAAINLSAIMKYGSVEFRSLGTNKDILSIQEWINMLLKIKDHSKVFKEPHDIVEGVSKEGGLHFLSMIMEEYTSKLTFPNTQDMLMSGVRLVQDIAYTPVKNKPVTLEQLEKKKGINKRKLILEDIQWGPVAIPQAPDQPPQPQLRKSGRNLPSEAAATNRLLFLKYIKRHYPVDYYVYRKDDFDVWWPEGIQLLVCDNEEERIKRNSLITMYRHSFPTAEFAVRFGHTGEEELSYIRFDRDFPEHFEMKTDTIWQEPDENQQPAQAQR